jgi:FHA domain
MIRHPHPRGDALSHIAAARRSSGADRAGTPTVESPASREERAAVPAPWLRELARASGTTGACLCIEDELDDGLLVIPLLDDRTHIGRGLATDVRLDDPTVSRRHALIVRRADGLTVVDDRSLNGVLVNGRRVGSSPLRHGDEIRLGARRLYYAEVPCDAEAPADREAHRHAA